MIPALLLLLQSGSRLEALLHGRTSDPITIATALGAALFLGAAHALTPGHGKTIVAAYLVGARGRIADAVYLGSVVTLTHTASVFLLGLAALYASQHIAMERIYPRLSLLSGVLVMAIGLWLLRQRLRGEAHLHHHHHHHGDEHHHHEHIPHAPTPPVPHSAAPARGRLLALGVSGGLVPCPEALVVLMISISLGKLVFGLVILVAFSLGLAAVLIAIGIAMVMAAPALKRITGEAGWMRALPVVSAAVVTVLGVVLVVQAVRAMA